MGIIKIFNESIPQKETRELKRLDRKDRQGRITPAERARRNQLRNRR